MRRAERQTENSRYEIRKIIICGLINMILGNTLLERYFFCKCFLALVALVSVDEEVP